MSHTAVIDIEAVSEKFYSPVSSGRETDPDVVDFMTEFIETYSSCKHYHTIEEGARTLKQKYHVCPSKAEIRAAVPRDCEQSPQFKRWLIKRVARSESGVLVITIVSKPGPNVMFSCPHKCAYCPTETDLSGVPTQPKSYISTEPAMLRALRSNFDIRGQILDRLRAYIQTGNISRDGSATAKKKIEMIVLGGTWDVMPREYRDEVILHIYWTLNTATEIFPRAARTLAEEKAENERSPFALVGLTIETRPDYITSHTIHQYLDYGVTRVQIGVQHTDDVILRKIKRGCTTEHTILAIRLLKSVGLKVVIHIMPDLPSSSKEIDMEMFRRLLSDTHLVFDDIKIYPTAVIKTADETHIVKSLLSDWAAAGEYQPYAEKNIYDLIEVLEYYKSRIHPSVRIQRLVRDIPVQSIEMGYNKKSNLRQILQTRGRGCNCIRCHEIKDHIEELPRLKLMVRRFPASCGEEVFVSFETEPTYWNMEYIEYCARWWIWRAAAACRLVSSEEEPFYSPAGARRTGFIAGFLRLRFDPLAGVLCNVPELRDAALIREVHVYGAAAGGAVSSQHKGLGAKLVRAAEKLARVDGWRKMAIISGVGVREYYREKLGYSLEGTYMTKQLNTTTTTTK